MFHLQAYLIKAGGRERRQVSLHFLNGSWVAAALASFDAVV